MNFTKRLSSLLALCAGLLASTASVLQAESVSLKVDLDRPLLTCDGPQRLVLKVGMDCLRLPLDPAHRAPVNLALVLDRSGSMQGEKLERAKEAAIQIVRRLSPSDTFSLVTFDDKVKTLIPARPVRDPGLCEELIRGIEVGGNTALYAGVREGAAALRGSRGGSDATQRVILLSDGQANVGPSSPESLASLGSSLMREGISVSTIGLGLGFNEDLMTRLARSSDGNTYFAENASDLGRIFDGELGEVLGVVARRVVLTLEFPDYVRPIAFVGREGQINGRRAELTLNQLYSAQEKFALIEVEVMPRDGVRECPVAEARLSYEDALKRREITLHAKGNVRFTEDRRAMERAVNAQVQVAYAENVIAKAKDDAVRHVDAGRRDVGASQILDSLSRLMAMPAAPENRELAKKTEEARNEAEKMRKEGLSNTERKQYRAAKAQVETQQSVR